MDNKYAIINIETIQKRIDELESIIKITEPDFKCVLVAEQVALAQVVSQSTPLIPEIEKSIKQGIRLGKTSQSVIEQFERKQEYINNLKLDI